MIAAPYSNTYFEFKVSTDVQTGRKDNRLLERVFKLSQNGTCLKTEILAGLTTFLTMAYIVALNPNLLTNFGAAGVELWNGVFLVTCIASADSLCPVFGEVFPDCLI